jgi:hypothetical protein
MEMGNRRAGDRALGQSEMSKSPGSCFTLTIVASLVSMIAAGCSSIGGYAGAVAGVATGAVSSNPAVGVAVGISVKAATDTALHRLFKELQSDEQDRIADIAGHMNVGDRAPWNIHHAWSFSSEAGDLEVIGGIDNALAACKEVLFSVASGLDEARTEEWFITQTCRQSDGHWRWAAAEPAVERWGTLQ